MWCVLLFKSLGDRSCHGYSCFTRPGTAPHRVALAEVASRSTRNTGVHHRWKPCWGSACCCCLCAAWYVMVLARTRHCFAAHPRFGVQFFSLGDKVEWLAQRSWSWELANAVAWLAVAIGWSLGLVALVNEVRALPSAS